MCVRRSNPPEALVRLLLRAYPDASREADRWVIEQLYWVRMRAFVWRCEVVLKGGQIDVWGVQQLFPHARASVIGIACVCVILCAHLRETQTRAIS